MSKFKFGDFVEIHYKLGSISTLVDYSNYLPDKKKTIGIVICTVPEKPYDILLGFPIGTALANWSKRHGINSSYFRENKIPNYIKNQFEFWFTCKNHLKLVEKNYEI